MDATPFSEFRQFLSGQGRADRTVSGYVGDLQVFSRWYEQTNGEELNPSRLTPTDVKQYRAYLQTVRRAKPSTINRRLAALRIYGAAAVQLRQAEYNPAHGIRGVEEQRIAPKWLGKREQAALIREAERRFQLARTDPARRQAARDKAILVLLLNTGLRISELAALETRDVILSERRGVLTVRAGKGEKKRTIPLNANARKALQEWYPFRPETGCELVFISQRNEGLKTRAVQSVLEMLGAAARVEGVTPHVLRHTFAKNLVDMGVSLEKVAMLLGHSNLNTTRIYVTPGLQDLEQAVGRLDD